jgi:outer membrane protein assembly factor BamB
MRNLFFVAVSFWFGVALLRADDTTGFRGGAARSGSTPEVVPPSSTSPGLTARWATQVGPWSLVSTPAVGGGRVYFGAEDGKLYCVSAEDGSVFWSYQTGGPVRGSISYSKGRVYFGSRDGSLYCLHARTGARLWSVFHGGWQFSTPLVVGGVVYFGAGDPSTQVRAVDALTGAPAWAGPATLGQTVMSSPAWHAASGRLIIGDNSGRWYAIDGSDGSVEWTYVTRVQGVFLATAAVEGDRVVFCSGDFDRSLHVVDAWTGLDLKTPVEVRPGTSLKVGGDPATGAPQPELPETWVRPEEYSLLLNTPEKPPRDAMVDALAAADGFDAEKLKAHLDLRFGQAPSGSSKPGDVVTWSRPVRTSSPALVGGIAYITHRELSGVDSDHYLTVAIDTSPSAAANVVWGTSLEGTDTPQTWMNLNVVAAPTVSNGAWVYTARGRYLQVRQASDGAKVAEADAAAQILGGPAVANGRVFVTTDDGRVIAYDTGNRPPRPPVSFSPAGGMSVTWTLSPTLVWFNAADPESPASLLASELQYGLGYANRDLEIQPGATVAVGAGSSSHTLASPVAPNTHVYWRVRVQDPSGAWSEWSDIQDFWVNRDPYAPEPPRLVEAIPQNMAVKVVWGGSPSPDVLKYRIYHKRTADFWGSAVLVDDIGSGPVTVSGLVNGVSHDFMVTAVDLAENESTGVVASATPMPDITVDGAGAYATIQAALDAAAPGEEVILGARSFTGENLVVRRGARLRGHSARHTKVTGLGFGPVIRLSASSPKAGSSPETVVSDLAVTGGGTGIAAGTEDVLVRNVVVYGVTGDAITASSGGTLRVVNCTLMDNGGSGVSASTDADSTLVRSTVAGNNGGYGIQGAAGSSATYTTAFGNTLGNFAPGVSGEGNSETPAALESDYTEASSSPTIDTGDPADDYAREPQPNGGRVNRGGFGNTAYAATTPASSPGSGGGGGGGGGGCGALGVEFLLALLGLRALRRLSPGARGATL